MKINDKLNNEQKEAVKALGSNIIVSASAGAGKTTVLVERFVKRLVEDNVKIDEIIALTFTNAASENMKYRIKERIDELINENNDDTERLVSLKNEIDNAQISTIHSYCLKLIKEYYYLLGIDSNRINNIVDDVIEEKLKSEAFNRTLANTKDYINITSKISNSVFSLDDLKTALDNIINVAINCYKPLDFFSKSKEKQARELTDIGNKSNVLNYYFVNLKAYVNLALSYANALRNEGIFDETINILENASKASTYSDTLNELLKINYRIPVAQEDVNEEIRKYICDPILKKKIAPLLIDEKILLQDYNNSVNDNNVLLNIAEEYYKNYQKLKEEYDVLDFNDFEHFTYELFTKEKKDEPSELAIKLKNKYKEIMIDEFQDTSDIQYKILSFIINNNLFAVGDIKQSIYRFRNANPKIMENLINDSSFKHINLSTNYRSSEAIVNFNNTTYEYIMNSYKPNTFKDIDKQKFGAKHNKAKNVPQLMLAKKDVIEINDLIIDKVKELISDNVKLSDICILTRTHDKKKLIKNLLAKNNIPCISYDKDSYLTTKSLDVLYSYFKYLLNNHDLIAKCTVLSSSLYSVSDEELFNGKTDFFNNQKLDDDVNKINEFINQNDILGAISYILDINNYYYRLTIQEKADIDLFISELNTISVNTLFDLVSYIDTNRDLAGKTALVVTDNKDAVKIMTIHSSKGLEFKHVILLSESLNQLKESKSSVLADSELGIGMYQIYGEYHQKRRTLKKEAIKAKNNIEDLLEYQRLFYVATTRAIESLYIIDDTKLLDSDSYSPFIIKTALFFARKGFTSYLLNIFKLEQTNTFNFEICNSLKIIEPFKVIKKNDNKKLIDTNLFDNSINESKRASEFVYSITLKENFEFGNLIHKYFETLDLNAKTNEEEIKEIFKANAPKVIKAVNSFKNSELIQKIKDFEITHEYSYVYKKDNIVNRGSIDFMAKDKDIIYIIDYKTDRRLSEDELKSHYKKQIDTYKEIIRQNNTQTVIAYLYSIELNKFIEM